MPDYQIYFITDEGEFRAAETIDAPDDVAAVEVGQQLVDGFDVEVWQRDRKLARLSNDERDGRSPRTEKTP